jgi:hypothetical protein
MRDYVTLQGSKPSLGDQSDDVIDGEQVEIVPFRCSLIDRRRESRSTGADIDFNAARCSCYPNLKNSR